TLIQTRKIRPFPVVLFNSSYWKGLLDWLRNQSLTHGYISEEDFELLRLSDNPEEIVDIIRSWYLRQAITGKQAIA
ncbi:MAG: LOG family protein, partial [Dehalococcoidales bacterium]|nr:LOG family protein [Dehalococcoidales bacterium]